MTDSVGQARGSDDRTRARPTWLVWGVEALGAGLLLGLGARGAMRLLSWLAGTPTGFSTGGSVEIVVFGALLGMPVALAIFSLRQWRRWSHPWVGLWTTLALFMVTASCPSPSAQSALGASPLPGWVAVLVFGGLFALAGLWIDVRWHRQTHRPLPLTLRSGLAALLMPGTVAGVIPWLIARGSTREVPVLVVAVGYTMVALGVALLTSCIVRFADEGRGTLAPYDPPRMLVARGAYRFTRNPMYLGVIGIVMGQALVTMTPALLVYGAAVTACFHVFVVAVEEPSLERQFGQTYRDYRAAVPRWVGVLSSARGGSRA